MDSPPVPGELLVDIFLRLPDPADLARASAACVSFRRLVTDRSFLRRYRKLHAPPFLGFLDQARNFHPAVPPHPSASAASAVALAADFSFAFFPAPAPTIRWFVEDIRDGPVLPAPASRWVVEDTRDGRVLLGRSFSNFDSVDNLKDIVVCDPLHRQYLLLPPMPDKLFREVYIQRHIFLVPPAGSVDKEEETAFRVFWMARRGDKLVAIVFSSSTGQWQDGPSHSWRDSFGRFLKLPGAPNFPVPQYAYAWVLLLGDKLQENFDGA